MKSLIAQYFLNHRLDTAEIDWQMQELAAQGYHGVYAHARAGMLTPYFSEAWWEAIRTIVAACRRHGLELWIWDEDYFPSGLCGGRVVWSDPGLVSRQLAFTVTQVDASGPIEVDFAPGMLLRAFALEHRPDGSLGTAEDVTAHCGTRRQRWGRRYMLHRAYSPLIDRIGHPHWRTAMEENRFALAWTPPQPATYTLCAVLVHNGSPTHPDLLRPEGIRSFLELSYQPYAERFPDELGSVIVGAFTDEPSPGGSFPWSAGLPAAFEADHGYDLLDALPHLALDLNERTPQVRHHYRQTQHRLQKAHYLEQIAGWCREHEIRFGGHLTRTEWLSLVAAWWPNELRFYESMDIPACDPLGASEGWRDAAAYHTGVKVASSAAHLFGKPQAGSDCLAVVGDEASLRDLKYHFDYQMVLGINHFTVHGLSYSVDGPRKDEVPPSIFYQHTQWHHMGTLLAHVEQLAAELTGGDHVCALAVLYPSTSLACQIRADDPRPNLPDEALIHALVEQLLSHHCDFDFVDEVAVAGTDRAGALPTPEAYRTIILPHLRYIDHRTAAGLLRFAQGGGRVIAVGTMPAAVSASTAEPLLTWNDASIEHCAGLDTELLAGLATLRLRGAGAHDVFALRRRRDGRLRTLLFNRAETWFEGELKDRPVRVPPGGSVLIREEDAGAGAPVADAHLGASSAAAADVGGAVPEPPQADTMDLSMGWSVTFPDNQLPLSFWSAARSVGGQAGVYAGGADYDLMQRHPDPVADGSEPVRYTCRFMLCGEVDDARLVLEDETVAGTWTLLVNDTPIQDWRRCRHFDCRNQEAHVGAALRSGSTPTLNTVTIETSGPGRGLHEIPYLYGRFTCEYRYGHLSFPFLRGGGLVGTAVLLQPWTVLGYPTFSGTAVYQREIRINAAATYALDLGRVEDCAAVQVDERQIAVLPWPPYRCLLGRLEPGVHRLEIELCNAPANRNRAAGLPAGLLGPVRLEVAEG